MKNWFKKLSIPSGDKKEVTAYKSWVVRWYVLDVEQYSWGSFTIKALPESEIFPTEDAANEFATQLRESQKMLRYKGNGLKVTVESNQ